MTNSKNARLAKLTAPLARGLVQRERLFTMLDCLEHGRLAWVSGPGGAGKTSLLASWLTARQRNVVWYRIDAGDRDPATLFHYLALSLQDGTSSHEPLPHFTPEFMAGLDTFARSYFQGFFAQLTPPCVVVFDSCQDAGADSGFEQIVALALHEAPAGIAIACVSRAEPGAALARWVAHPDYVRIGWDHLRLDALEAAQIAQGRGHDAKAVPVLLEAARGWAAGFVLMLRAQAQGVANDALGAQGAQGAVFDYFAGEILSRAAPATRDFLLRACVLPVLPPSLVAELTGNPQAGELLEELYRSNFFTERRRSDIGQFTYEFHPLFRAFLCARSRLALPPEHFAQLCERAALLLEQAGQIEAAVELRIQACDWPALTRTICSQAPVLMAQGRWQTLDSWIGAIPRTITQTTPWLMYWLGVCCCMTDPLAARAHLQSAHEQFQAADDKVGALLACASALETFHLAWSALKSAAPWIDRFERALAAVPAPPLEVELRVISGLLGVTMAQPQHSMLPKWVLRAVELLRALPDPMQKVAPMAFAVSFYIWSGELERAHSLIDTLDMDRYRTGGEPLSPIAAYGWEACVAWQRAEHEQAWKALAKAEAIAESSGVRVLSSFLCVHRIYAELSAGELARAQESLTRLRACLVPGRELDVAHLHFLSSGALLLAGNLRGALEIVLRELPGVVEMGAPFGVATWRVQAGQTFTLNGHFDAAREALTGALDFGRAMPSRIIEFHALMALAHLDFCTRREATALEALREALAIGRAKNYMNCHPWWIPQQMSVLFSRALQAGIEPEYVRRFIRHRRVDPESPEVPGWPWPLRIYTLNQLRVLKDDEPLRAGRKAPRRVLELLQAIVALGPRKASRERLTEAVWRDAEGDAARDAFENALHRLRKLLGDDAVILEHGQVTLAPMRVWVDAEAFERLADGIQQSAEAGTLGHERSMQAIDEAIALYQGHFLANEPDQPWMLPMRERLRSRLERIVTRGAAHWEQAGDLPRATALYQRGVEVDPVAELFYRRLMACRAQAGDRAGALEIYRRCRQMLSSVLGISPSAETEALRNSLLRA
ncbi:MAG: transcriptional activator domain [Ramlibacter sp.]|nr:transcriptional activator domain [Ramlibacter sp.]